MEEREWAGQETRTKRSCHDNAARLALQQTKAHQTTGTIGGRQTSSERRRFCPARAVALLAATLLGRPLTAATDSPCGNTPRSVRVARVCPKGSKSERQGETNVRRRRSGGGKCHRQTSSPLPNLTPNLNRRGSTRHSNPCENQRLSTLPTLSGANLALKGKGGEGLDHGVHPPNAREGADPNGSRLARQRRLSPELAIITGAWNGWVG